MLIICGRKGCGECFFPSKSERGRERERESKSRVSEKTGVQSEAVEQVDSIIAKVAKEIESWIGV